MTWDIVAERTKALARQLKNEGESEEIKGRIDVVMMVRRTWREGHVDWTRIRTRVANSKMSDAAKAAASREVESLQSKIPDAKRLMASSVTTVWKAKEEPQPASKVEDKPLQRAPADGIVRRRMDPVPVLSFDASCNPKTRSCGAAYELKEPKGTSWRVVDMRTLGLPFVGNAAAEAEACLAGMRRALEAGVGRLQVLGDCQGTLDAVNGVPGRGKVSAHREIRELRKRFAFIEGIYVGREANALADALASEATVIRRGQTSRTFSMDVAAE